MEETLFEYLTRQKVEREINLENYNKAKADYEEAKARFESFGDISIVEKEIAQLERFIDQVSQQENKIETLIQPTDIGVGNNII